MYTSSARLLLFVFCCSLSLTVVGKDNTSWFEAQPCLPIKGDSLKHLKSYWGKKEYRKANTARFALYMGPQQRKTILYMNLARQDAGKFTELVIKPYQEAYPDIKCINKLTSRSSMEPLYPSFQLWIPGAFHALYSGVVGHEGHAFFNFRMAASLNFSYPLGENCSYGYFNGLHVAMQLLTSPPHRKNILTEEYARTAVSKNLHINYRWNSVTEFSGPKWRDMIIRNRWDRKNREIFYGVKTDFSKLFLELGYSKHAYCEPSNHAFLNYGAEFVKDKTWVVGPRVYFGTGIRAFSFGNNLLMYTDFKGSTFYTRPELGLFMTFGKSGVNYYFSDMDRCPSMIKIAYGYNILLGGQGNYKPQSHVLSLTIFRAIGWKK